MLSSIFSLSSTAQLSRSHYVVQVLLSIFISFFSLIIISLLLGKGFVTFLQQNTVQETWLSQTVFYGFYFAFATILCLELLFLIKISIQRLRATQHSAWWLLTIFIPIINLLLIIMLFLLPSKTSIQQASA